MTRDHGLEEQITLDLKEFPELIGKAMFGGWGWMLRGHLLCGARQGQLLVRLGKGNDQWALMLQGAAQMESRGRKMTGWVRVNETIIADGALRRKLLREAVNFVESLPPK